MYLLLSPAHSTGYQSRRAEKKNDFFPLVVVVVHLDYIFMSGGAGGQREAHTARKKEEERTHRASVSFEGQMEKICLNWNNNEN